MFKVNEVVGVIKLKNAYDKYAVRVLGGRLKQIESERTAANDKGRSKRKPASFKVTAALPTLDEYKELKRKAFTTTADSLMDEAYSEIESLGGEMREWYDNLTDTLQQNDQGTRVGEAADALENISRQDSVDIMSSIDVYHLPGLDLTSRAKRWDEASSMLSAVAGAIHDYASENRPEEKDEDDKETAPKAEDDPLADVDWDELEGIADQCENDAGESIEFPGMYN